MIGLRMSGTRTHIRSTSEELAELLLHVEEDVQALHEWIDCQLANKGLQKNLVIRNSKLNATFAYQILSGARRASRDKLIQLAFGMQLGADDTSVMLEKGGLNRLLPTSRRDTIIGWALDHNLGLAECDDVLWENGEKTISPSPHGEVPA